MSDQEWQSRHSDDDSIPQTPTGPSTVRRYNITRAYFSRHYDITTDAGDQLFRADMSTFRPGKPDLTLRHGPSATSPIVGMCYLPKGGREYKLGLGDPEQPGGMTWETMNRTDLWGLEHRWRTDLLAASPGEPRTLFWKRTSTKKGDGQTGSTIWRTVKLQDEETGEIVALYTPGPGLRLRGVLEIKIDAGRSFELMLLMTRVGVIERSRRW